MPNNTNHEQRKRFVIDQRNDGQSHDHIVAMLHTYNGFMRDTTVSNGVVVNRQWQYDTYKKQVSLTKESFPVKDWITW